MQKAFEVIRVITDQKKLFGEIEIKKNKLFICLTYDEEINNQK